MIQKVLAILAASAVLAIGCSDDPSPTQPNTNQPTPNLVPTPTPTPRPDPSRAPVVTSAEPTTTIYPGAGGWLIHGSFFVPDPVVTFESGASVITPSVELSTARGEVVGVWIRPGDAPGSYTPCVSTFNGKGCGNFVITVD
jgi:hypothetical protein